MHEIMNAVFFFLQICDHVCVYHIVGHIDTFAPINEHSTVHMFNVSLVVIARALVLITWVFSLTQTSLGAIWHRADPPPAEDFVANLRKLEESIKKLQQVT